MEHTDKVVYLEDGQIADVRVGEELNMPTSSALFSWAWSLKKKEQTSSMMNIFLLIYFFLFPNYILGQKYKKIS